MDPNTISPSWVEHCEKLHPGLEFVNFYAEDNALADRDFLSITTSNLQRLTQILPFGPFASLLAFDDSLRAFLDSYLKSRERMSLNQALFPLDFLVFSTFYRFATQFPTNIHFTPGSKASSLLQLNVLTPERIIRLVNLFHRPASDKGPARELVTKWLALFPQVKRELAKEWSTISPAMPAAWRALQEICALELDLVVLQRHFTQASASASDRSNLLACALHIAKQGPAEFAQALASPAFSPHLLCLPDFQALGKEFRTELKPVSIKQMESAVPIDVDLQAIFYQGKDEDEEEEEERGPSNEPDELVDQLKEVYPHLGRFFCQRLLEVCNFSLEQCVQRVMEGDLPSELLAIDFSAEEDPRSMEQQQQPRLRATTTAPSRGAPIKERYVVASTALPSADGELKAKLLELYDNALYNDEYDDTLEAGTTGEGNRFTQTEEEEEVAKPVVPPAAVAFKRAPLAPAPAPKSTFRPMTKLVEASVVDVNGERRNAQGRLVEEDVLMRPNLNREFKPKQPTTSQAVAAAKASETEEQKLQRIKRERARKTTQGNRERRIGDDKKKTKAGI